MYSSGWSFGKYIRMKREDIGLGLNELADKLMMSPSYINKIETKGEIPCPKLIEKLAPLILADKKALFQLAFKERVIIAARTYQDKYGVDFRSVEKLIDLFKHAEYDLPRPGCSCQVLPQGNRSSKTPQT